MGTCQGLNSPHWPRIVTSNRQGARKAAGKPSALMQLPTPEDCMATMARAPASQQPVAMPMPSCSLESVTRLALLLASISLSSWVKPPSGMVQTVAILRTCMARRTSSDQLETRLTQENSPDPAPGETLLGNLRQTPHHLQWANIAHAGREGCLQRLVDVGDVAGDDFIIGSRENIFVDPVGTTDVIEHPSRALLIVVDCQFAHVVLVFDPIDGVEERVVGDQEGEASAHIVDNRQFTF